LYTPRQITRQISGSGQTALSGESSAVIVGTWTWRRAANWLRTNTKRHIRPAESTPVKLCHW